MSEEKINEEKKPTCGIIMPIGAIEKCSANHWTDVLSIIKDACMVSGFVPNMVNQADDIGIIHQRIVENIYSSDIVICDVSCQNANVMFELGMRLAFDKPTIIIKDDNTSYSFDTSLIEHIEYPRDLRFTSIVKFKENLRNKMSATFEKSKDPTYSTFLKNFGKYKIAHLEETEVTSDTFILTAIEDLKREVRMIRNQSLNDINQNESRLRRNLLESEITTEEGKNIFKKYVQDYIQKNKPHRYKDINIILDEMTTVLEKNLELLMIAGNPENLQKLIIEAIGKY